MLFGNGRAGGKRGLSPVRTSHYQPTSVEGGVMGIFRVLYHAQITVGSGGRITIPQEMRDDLRIDDGDTLTARMEQSETGQRQITIWKEGTAQ